MWRAVAVLGSSLALALATPACGGDNGFQPPPDAANVGHDLATAPGPDLGGGNDAQGDDGGASLDLGGDLGGMALDLAGVDLIGPPKGDLAGADLATSTVDATAPVGDLPPPDDLGSAADLPLAADLPAPLDLPAPVDAKVPDLKPPVDLALADLKGVDLKPPADLGGGDMGPSTLLKLRAGHLSLYGVTSDGYAVYHDITKSTVEAIPIAGGAADTILTSATPAATQVLVAGRAVFAWKGASVQQTNGVGALTVWTAATKAKSASLASIAGAAAAADDGKHVLFTKGASMSGSTASLVVATADLATTHTVLTAVGFPQGDATCQPQLGFAGAFALASHCALGSSSATVSSFTAAGKEAVLQAGASETWSADKAGTLVLVTTTAGSARVVPIAGGGAIVIDGGALPGLMLSDGSAVVYPTQAGALRRSAIKLPKPLTLVAKGVAGVLTLSPDDTRVLYYGQLDPMAATLLTDLFVASTKTPGTPVTLHDAPDGTSYGDAFTADSSQALYFTGVDDTTAIGTFDTRAAAGGAEEKRADMAWVAWAANGPTKVVYNDNVTLVSNARPRGDIHVIDAAKPGTGQVLVKQADADMFLSPAKDRVVFVVNTNMAQQGLYAGLLP